jgi:hypothetical protein
MAALFAMSGFGVAACGDGANGQLGGGPGTSSWSGLEGGVVTVNQETSDAGTTGEGGSSAAQDQALFDALLPKFNGTCGGDCHQKGLGGAPAYLSLPDPYASVTKFPGIVVATADQSILLTKGQHEGPNLVDPLRTQIEQWLTAESQGVTAMTLPSTPVFDLQPGTNTVVLSNVAKGITGTSISFVAKFQGSVLTLSSIQVTPPKSTGVEIAAPMFVVIPSQGAAEPDNSFSNVDQTFSAGQKAMLAPDVLILTDWSQGAQMKIEFNKIAPAAAVSDAGAGGCKALSSFIANAVPAIQGNTCMSCHDTGGSGNTTFDLSGIDSPSTYGAACDQALLFAEPMTPPNSDIILAPTGQLTSINHPFTSAPQSFVTAMETWITAEQ